MSEVQAVIFDNKKWRTPSAARWLSAHGYRPIKRVHHTENYLRYRIRDPRKYGSFRLTKKEGGIRLVLGRV